MTKRRLLALGAAAAVAAGALATSAFALQGGSPDNGAHPYVGMAIYFPKLEQGALVPNERCSGALISDDTFVTAAHCFPNGALVFVDVQDDAIDDLHAAGFGSAVPGYVVNDPNFHQTPGGLPGSDRNDVAVVKLAAPIDLPVYATPAAVGADDLLPNNQKIINVGYGVQDAKTQLGSGFRMAVTAKVIPGGGATSSDFLKISGGNTCFGDSGGPNLVGDTVVAINSYGPSASCNAVSYSQRLDTPEVNWFITGGYAQFLN